MLYTWGIPIPKDYDVLSLYQKALIKSGSHNFQQHARKMLYAMNVKFEKGANDISKIPTYLPIYDRNIKISLIQLSWGLEDIVSI